MYHYTVCGLDNVWLENGFVEHKTPYGKAVSVINAEDLHSLLAFQLANKPGRLTGKEFRFLRVQLGLTQSGLAHMQGVTEQAVSLWERTGKVPKANDLLTRFFYLGNRSGNTPISQAIERTKLVERLVHQRFVARTHGTRWKSAVSETVDQELESA